MKQKMYTAQLNNAVADILTTILADTMMLIIKSRELPWNVIDNNFLELENLLDDRNNKLGESIQELAVLKNNMGVPVSGTLENYLRHSSLQMAVSKYHGKREALKDLLRDHEIIISALRKNINDCYEIFEDIHTGDILNKQLKINESIAYNLRIYLGNETKVLQQQIAC